MRLNYGRIAGDMRGYGNADASQMPPASATAVYRAITEVNKALGKALGSHGLNFVIDLIVDPIDVTVANLNNLGSWDIPGVFSSSAANQSQIGANLAQLTGYVNEWQTTQLRWAITGARDDGTAFDFGKWFSMGKDYAESAAAYGNFSWDNSILLEAWRLVAKTVKDVTSPSQWPWWLYVGIGLAALSFVASISRDVREVGRATS
jgi:hypothetical protein